LELDEWEDQEWADKPEGVEEGPVYGHIDRVHASRLTLEQFRDKYETPNVPVLIDGIVDGWEANEAWEPQQLFKRLRHRKFKCGEVSEAETGSWVGARCLVAGR
jgi:hypothetical protein